MMLIDFVLLIVSGRFLRHLAATNVLEETGVDSWKLTPFTKAMGDETTHIDLSVQAG